MGRLAALLAAAMLVASSVAAHAAACDSGDVVLDDKFADDSGGWAINPAVEVKDGSFVFKLPADAMQSDLNVTFDVTDADICSETVWPEGDPMVLGAGLLFWGEDTRSYFQFGVLNNGKYWIARRENGKWHTVVENVESDAIKTKPGESNTLRVKTSGNFATFYINDTKLRDLRGRAPKSAWRFGLSGDNFDKQKEAKIIFKSVKVTE
jgi:hypothetical protein